MTTDWTAPPAYTPPTAAPPPSQPVWRRTWFVITAAIVAVFVVFVAIAAASPKAKTVTKTVAGPVTTQTATETVTATAATVTATPTVVRTVATQVHTVTITYTPPVKVAVSDGTFLVGRELAPGTYHTTPGAGGCYYARSNKGGGLGAIIVNDNITGPTSIDIAPSDYSFTSSGGCDWVRIG